MTIKRQGVLLLFGISLIIAYVTITVLLTASQDLSRTLVRLLGLYGFVMVCIAASITPFLKEVSQFFGKSFLKIHHFFALFGLAFISLHPVSLAIGLMNASVFLPRFDSWIVFWQLAGRPALIVLYIALFAVFLRRKAPKHWRILHALMYLAILLGIVHGNLIGSDFENLPLMIILNTLAAVSLVAFFLKRYQNYRIQMKVKEIKARQNAKSASK
jgi:predicted ferric reductase